MIIMSRMTDNRMTQFWESCDRWGYECDCFYGEPVIRCGKTPNQFHHCFTPRDNRNSRFKKWADDLMNQQKTDHTCHVDLKLTNTPLNKEHMMALQMIRYGDGVYRWIERCPPELWETRGRPIQQLYLSTPESLILKVKEM
jgi:hypothetical protein